MTAVQLLPPRQRAVLVLRDVLGFGAREVADMLESSEPSVTTALARARAQLRREPPDPEHREPPNSPTERALVASFTRALADGDVDGLVALLAHDVWLAMPPLPLRYQGRELAARFHAAVTFRAGRTYRSIPTRANGQPAFGLYFPDAHRRLPGQRADGAHPVRRPDRRHDPVRQRRAAPLRAARDPAGRLR